MTATTTAVTLQPVGAQSTVVVRCDGGTYEAGPIGNRFSNISHWHYLGTTPDERMWHEWAESVPAGWLKRQYPWLEEMQIFIASGGAWVGYPRRGGDTAECEFNRDLFKDPGNRTVLDDYDFAPLVRACRNMLRQGVRPCLKLHAVPLKYSSAPMVEWFRVNNRPPDDHRVYADYLSALVQAMVDAFGRDEVRRWRWFVGTEFENRKWWEAADGTAESSAGAFLEFYDWSVFAVERVLGPGAGPIGSHAMMQGGLWNPDLFFEHCRSGRNAATGGVGTRLDFFAISVYDRTPGTQVGVKPQTAGGEGVLASLNTWKPGNEEVMQGAGGAELAGLASKVARTRAALEKHGFGAIPIEVSEGGILFGTDGRWLWHGLCLGGSYDASWTALSFRRMLDERVSLWSRWPLMRTSGLFHGVETASTHALRMIERMSADRRLVVNESGVPSGNVRAVASLAPDNATVRVLAFHHAPDIRRPGPSELLSLQLEKLPFEGRVEATIWRVDRDHGDFWPQWESDRQAQGITDGDYVHSRDQVDVAHALKSREHVAFWRSREVDYVARAALPPPLLARGTVRNGVWGVELELPCFSVVLVEVRKANAEGDE